MSSKTEKNIRMPYVDIVGTPEQLDRFMRLGEGVPILDDQPAALARLASGEDLDLSHMDEGHDYALRSVDAEKGTVGLKVFYRQPDPDPVPEIDDDLPVMEM